MKIKASTGRKLRYGGTSVAMTALILAAVILVNVIFSMLTEKFRWYLDMTPEFRFTLSDEFFDLLENGSTDEEGDSAIEMVDTFRAENKKYNEQNGLKKGDADYKDENLMINIIFCADEDYLTDDTYNEYVYHAARDLEAKFPDHISVKTYNTIKNPSSVDKYLTTTTDTLARTDVVIECGTEFRVRPLESFYIFNDDEIYGLNIEKAYASSILAVTRAEAPLACITSNHGEQFADTSFLTTLGDAGYNVQYIDLKTEEIPEECRLLVIHDPTTDFLVKDGVSDIDEIAKLEDHLDRRNSVMVFMDPDTPRLNNLEDFLEEWGIKFSRYTESGSNTEYSQVVTDTSQSITTDGRTIIGNYSTSELAVGWTDNMQNRPVAPSVVFKNVMPVAYADSYEVSFIVDDEDASLNHSVAYKYMDGYSRTVYDLFTASENASAWANGKEVAQSTKVNPLKLMAVSVESYSEQEANGVMTDSAFVLACGSTEFATEAFLTSTSSSSYGNTDLLLTAFEMMGREPVAVGLNYKAFENYDMGTVTTAEYTQYIVTLTLVPIVVALCAGVFVIVRRKNR